MSNLFTSSTRHEHITKNLPHYRTAKREIVRVDTEIDKRVYVLYGLTEEEVKIIEGK